MRFLIFTGLFFLTTLGLAQSGARERSVYQLFDKPSKILWIQHFQGRMDDLTDIAISLAFDGKNCKGELIYLRSKEKFTLRGRLKNSLLDLEELDKQGKVSGHIAAELTDDGISGEWANFDKTIGSSIHLTQRDQPFELPSHCGNNKWVHVYQGNLGAQTVELILHKMNHAELRGIAYNLEQRKSYRLIGQLGLKNQFDIELQDSFGHVAGRLRGQFSNEQQIRANFTHTNGSSQKLDCQLTEAMSIGCVEYADYLSSYDVIYPQTNSPAFNRWMKQTAENWVAESHDFAVRANKRHPAPQPEQRASYRAFAWTDIEFLGDGIISGTFSQANTWTDEQRSRVFNFDLQRGREIRQEDVFGDDFDRQSFIRQYIHSSIEQHILYGNYQFRAWIAAADFSYFNIRREGIAFSTAFNPLYGRQHITIPYHILRPYFKKDNPVQRVAKFY